MERFPLLDRNRGFWSQDHAIALQGFNSRAPVRCDIEIAATKSMELPAGTSEGDTAVAHAEETDTGPAQEAAGSLQSFTKSQKVCLVYLGGANLMAGCVIAMMIPFFPLEASRRGVSETVTGAVFSCYALTQVPVYPLMGRLVPRLGARGVLTAGIATAGVSTLVFGALVHIDDTRIFIAACFVTRIVEAVGTAALNTASFTIVAQRFQERPGTAFGVLEMMMGVGVSVGPAVGGGLYELEGYGGPFYGLGTVMLLWAAVVAWLLPTEGPLVDTRVNFWTMLRSFATSGQLLLCSTVILTVNMNWSTIDPGIEPYVFHAMNIGPAALGLYFLVATGCFSVFGFFWGWLSDRISNTFAMIASCLIGSACGLLLVPPSPVLSLTPSRLLFGLGMVIKEIFQGGAFVPLFGKILRICMLRGMKNDIVTHSFISSMFFTFFALGNTLGPTLGGVVNDVYGFPTMVTLLAAWTFFVAMLAAATALHSR